MKVRFLKPNEIEMAVAELLRNFVKRTGHAISAPVPVEEDRDWIRIGRLLRAKGQRKFLLAKAMAEELAGGDETTGKTDADRDVEDSTQSPQKPK